MEICKHCRRLFDPVIIPRRFADSLLCSWHPGTATIVGGTGPSGDYADVWKWSCCDKQEVGPLVDSKVVNGTFDSPPPRSPGCDLGPHEPDTSLRLADEKLAAEIASLYERLRDVEVLESSGLRPESVFISYSHADRNFVDLLTSRLQADNIGYWRDEKDLLVGDVVDKAISDGIQRNTLFLVVLTPSSIKSKWVSRELDEAAHEAVENQKIILPVVAEGLGVAEVPARIRRVKCAVFSGDFESAYAILRRSIHLHIGRHRTGKNSPNSQS